MSFAPPTQQSPAPNPGQPTPSPFPPAAGGQRSTPIPGTPGSPVEQGQPGPFGQQVPPTSAQFLGSFTDSPNTPYVPAPGQQYAPMTPSPRRRRGGGLLVALLILGPVVGISVSVWAFLRGREASDQAQEMLDDAEATVDSILDDVQADLDDALDDVPPVSVPVTVPTDLEDAVDDIDDIADDVLDAVPPVSLPTETVPATVPAMSLFDPAGATAVMGTFDAAISGEPTRLLTATIYPQYAFVQAQDAAIPTHVDEYEYRDGIVGAPAPVTLMGDGDLEANLFSITEVDWSFINRAVTEAPSLMPTVEEGAVTHVIVERSVFRPDFSVTVRVYVSGPRGGGYVEYTAAGELIQVMV